MTTLFPILFGTASSGKTKRWSIRVTEDGTSATIQTEYGYEGGKMQTQQRTITEGKNKGKKNETTALEQAMAEARTAWIKKKEDNYAPRDQDLPMIETCGGRGKGMEKEAPLPMLAHDYHKLGKKINYPCYCQPKLDGTRCVGIPQKGLFSRRRKAYPHLEHIQAELDRLPPTLILDGELYSTELSFQTIVGMVKKQTLSPEEEKEQIAIQYHVYDVVNDESTFEERWSQLQELFQRESFRSIVLVETRTLSSEVELKPQHDTYVAAGYEGIMLRNKNGRYVNRRSNDLQKYKEFCSEEYTVVGFEEGDGAEKGCVIWVCETEEGKTFRCRPSGSREERQSDFLLGNIFIGQMLTVKFQELTDDGIPRFPVGVTFRTYE